MSCLLNSCSGTTDAVEQSVSAVVTHPIETQPTNQTPPINIAVEINARSTENEEEFTPPNKVEYTAEQSAHLEDLAAQWANEKPEEEHVEESQEEEKIQ